MCLSSARNRPSAVTMPYYKSSISCRKDDRGADRVGARGSYQESERDGERAGPVHACVTSAAKRNRVCKSHLTFSWQFKCVRNSVEQQQPRKSGEGKRRLGATYLLTRLALAACAGRRRRPRRQRRSREFFITIDIMQWLALAPFRPPPF